MYRARLADTLPRLLDRIGQAALSAGREPSEVRVVAVTKGHPIEALAAAVEAGLRDLGENRVEELEQKVAALGRGRATWHMVGHVQSRKAGDVARLADLIHSVDTVRLAARLSRAGMEGVEDVRVLAQVNTSGEASKSGFEPAEVLEQIHQLVELPRLKLDGVMTMAPLVEDEGVHRAAFQRLREVLTALRALDERVGSELSMGMTNDFESAIREGSTVVRIGTALFGERLP